MVLGNQESISLISLIHVVKRQNRRKTNPSQRHAEQKLEDINVFEIIEDGLVSDEEAG